MSFCAARSFALLKSAYANGRIRRAGAGVCKVLENVLNDSVFKRVKSYDSNYSSRIQKADCIAHRLFKSRKLTVDLNSNCLKRSPCRMRPVAPCRRRYCIFDNFGKFGCCFNGLVRTRRTDRI